MNERPHDDQVVAGRDVERLLALLGLARRAGKLALGATAVEKQVRSGRRPVLVIASDAGANQLRRGLAMRPIRGLVLDQVTRDELAQRLGRNELSIVAVWDNGFVRGLMKLGVVTEPREDTAASQ